MCTMQVPLVKLDDAHYKLVDQMEALVEAPPSLKQASSLTVKGAVKFTKGECSFGGWYTSARVGSGKRFPA